MNASNFSAKNSNFTANNSSGGPRMTWNWPFLTDVFLPIHITLVVLIILSNIAVLIAFLRMDRKSRGNVPNIFLLSQGIVDLFIGATNIARLTCMTCSPGDGFHISLFFNEYSLYLSMGILIMCTSERCMMFKAPFHHMRYATERNVIILVIIVWLITLAPPLCFVFLVVGNGKNATDAYFIGTSTVLLVGMAAVFILLALTYHAIKYSIDERITTVNSLAELAEASGVDSNHREAIIKERAKQARVTRIFLLMSIIYAVTFLPYLFGQIVVDSMSLKSRTIFISKTSLYFFYITSSFINPCITLSFKSDFRKTIMICRNKSAVATSSLAEIPNTAL